MKVDVVKFKGWSDSSGTAGWVTRYGITVLIDGKMKIIPVMSNAVEVFYRTNSYWECSVKNYGIDKTSWLAFGFEADWLKEKKITKVRRVNINLDDLLVKRSNYHNNGGKMMGSPYSM